MIPAGAFQAFEILSYQQGQAPLSKRDRVSSEEPLEIRLLTGPHGKPQHHPLTLTMRTPGQDYELAAGLLYSEGIIRRNTDIGKMTYCVGEDKSSQYYNVLQVRLHPRLQPNFENLARFSISNASCGLCGKVQIEQLQETVYPDFSPQSPQISPEWLYRLQASLQGKQKLFERTGGSHAAALFNTEGECLQVCEDIGRHNALDKLIGHFLLADQLPLLQHVLFLSGRASFEMVQKAMVASIPIIVCAGAPSSLAIQLAQSSQQTLIGFLNEQRFNVYSGAERIQYVQAAGNDETVYD